jgi:hypothetical protein
LKVHEKDQLKCDFCGLEFGDKKQEYDQHLDKENGNCLKQPVECQFKTIGCNVSECMAEASNSCLTRGSMHEHLTNYLSFHLILLLNYNITRIIELKAKISECDQLIESIRQKESFEINMDHDDHDDEIGQTIEIKNAISEADELKLQMVKYEIDLFRNTLENLISDKSRLSRSEQDVRLENQTLNRSYAQLKQIVLDLHKNLALNQMSILALQERLTHLENFSYDGTLLWKIVNFSEHVKEAQSLGQARVNSPPFYSNRYGYKMRFQLFLTGSKALQFSMLFFLMRGEFDSLQAWPFQSHVSMTLMEQLVDSQAKHGITSILKQDLKSAAYKKPISDVNSGAELPSFGALDKILDKNAGYLKDNTLFLKAVVTQTKK